MSGINDGRPISLYNADRQELIGIFAFSFLAGKYLYQPYQRKCGARTAQAASTKEKIHNSILKFPVAVRFASESQIKMLGEDDYLIIGNYYKPSNSQMRSFISTRLEMAVDQAECAKKSKYEKQRRIVNK